MLQALSYLYERDITYRDIKPANVLIQKFTSLITKLADFELSSEHFLLKIYCGVPLYIVSEGFKAKDNKKSGPLYK
jgi:serine/threonine protein kinase